MSKHTHKKELQQIGKTQSSILGELLFWFLQPLLNELNQQVDRRLVGNFLRAIMAITRHRHRNQGLVLSELGGYLLPAHQAPAGTKRLSRLLHCPRWHWRLIERFFWKKADEQLVQLRAQAATALVIWDESVLEKSESLYLEGLSPVRSSKAVRLKRILHHFLFH